MANVQSQNILAVGTLKEFENKLNTAGVTPIIKDWGGRAIRIEGKNYSLNQLVSKFHSLSHNNPPDHIRTKRLLHRIRSLNEAAHFALEKATLLQKIGTFFRRLANLFYNRYTVLKNIEASIPKPKNEHMISSRLISTDEISKKNLKEIIHELVEMDLERNFKPCSLERLNDILSELKNKHSLVALNTIPEFLARRAVFDPEPYTPLQYWTSKGNLQVVEALIKHGAVDRCSSNQEVRQETSALYVAAIHGHVEIVKFLLEKGARANVQFGNIYFSFIPYLIFNLCKLPEVEAKHLVCLDIILFDLLEHNPGYLKFQFKIPVDSNNLAPKGLNCIDYLLSEGKKETLVALLRRYGAKEKEIFTLDELKKANLDVGGGFTIGEYARFK